VVLVWRRRNVHDAKMRVVQPMTKLEFFCHHKKKSCKSPRYLTLTYAAKLLTAGYHFSLPSTQVTWRLSPAHTPLPQPPLLQQNLYQTSLNHPSGCRYHTHHAIDNPNPTSAQPTAMPLDTSSYSLSRLRLDGRRWNELRLLSATLTTQPSSSGSAYLSHGSTKILCTVSGPAEIRGSGGGGGGGGTDQSDKATIVVDVSIAGFAGVDRKKPTGGQGRADRRITELQSTIANAFGEVLLTNLYPHSTITLTIHVLALDGGLLAGCINACTLALIDAGVPMRDYLVAATAGSVPLGTVSAGAQGAEQAEPLLDLNGQEELELPFLTVATVGASERVSVLVMESRVRVERVEGMLAVAVDGCKQVRQVLDGVVRGKGKEVLRGRG
jgi:exosome complex component RRP41